MQAASIATSSAPQGAKPGKSADKDSILNTSEGPRQIVVVTGMSGAGRQTTLRLLEDHGYETIDNLPLALWAQTVALSGRGELAAGLALGIDVRSRGFETERLTEILDTLRAMPSFQVTLLFLDCDDEVLQRRFTETRRRHPLAPDRPLLDGILRERDQLSGLRDKASLIVDTSSLGMPDLRDLIATRVVGRRGQELTIHLASFAYKNGLPRSADLVFDVRFLRNPHYDPSLRAHTGQETAVQTYIQQDPDFYAFQNRLRDLLELTVSRYKQEGKSYLTIGFGCSGGKHRSVYLTEATAQWLKEIGWGVSVRHQVLGVNKQLTGAAPAAQADA